MTEVRNLVLRAKQNDAGAFSELYAAYYQEMYRYAYYVLRSVEDAEDVVMEAVADAFASIRSLRDPEKFKNWLFKILYNKTKRQKGRIYVNRPLELQEEIAAAPGAEEERIDNADLLDAMESLSDEERSILTLAVVSGYTSMEIAAVMSMNANTVRSKQQRALQKLRYKLEDGKEEGHERK